MNYNEMSLDELLSAYAEAFEENFPIFGVEVSGDEELREAIIAALKSGEPVKPEYPGTSKGAVY